MFKTLSESFCMVKASCGVVARNPPLALFSVLPSLAGVVVLAIFIALSGIAPAVAAEARPFTGDCTDSVLLGSEGWPELKRTMRAVRARKKAGEIVAALALQRKVVRMQCHNHYQRYYLAELMVAAGNFNDAVNELLQLDDLRVNDLEVRLLNPKNRLHPVLSSRAYAGSDLERRIANRKERTTARHLEFRTKLASLPSEERPPAPYETTSVCPFECCSFGRWSVLEDTPLYSVKAVSKPIAIAKSGTHVEGLTGDLHLQPMPVAIVHPVAAVDPAATIERGEIVFLLDTMGEGYRHVWHAGVVRTVESAGNIRAACAYPDEDCWGEWLETPSDRPDPVWWVKVRLEDGTGREGWTHAYGSGDVGGCG